MACVRCSLGELLTNGNVIDIFHACFRIGHYQPERSKGTTGGVTLLPLGDVASPWHATVAAPFRQQQSAVWCGVVLVSVGSTILHRSHIARASQDSMLHAHASLLVFECHCSVAAQSCSPRRRVS